MAIKMSWPKADTGRRLLLGAAGIAAFIAVWWLISLGSREVRVPDPGSVLSAIRENFWSTAALEFASLPAGGLASNLFATAQAAVLGVAIGLCLGLPIGVLAGRSRLVRTVVEPPLMVLGVVPVVVLLPFMSIWFGSSVLAQAGLTIFYATLVISVTAKNATANALGKYEKFGRSLGASSRTLVFSVVMPAIAPAMVGALRVAMAAAWGFTVIAEILGANKGIGRVIQVFATFQATASVIAALVCLGVLALIIDAVIARVGRWYTSWQE